MWSEDRDGGSQVRRFLILTTVITALLLAWSNSAGNELTASCVVLSPLNITLQPGEQTTVTATAYDELGNVIDDARIQWLPTEFDPSEHCVSVSRAVLPEGVIDPAKAVVTARLVGTCGVGALSVTHAGRFIWHEMAVSVTVGEPAPSPTPEITPEPTPTPKPPCSTRLPNGKCKRGCVCR